MRDLSYDILRPMLPQELDLFILDVVDSTNNYAMNLAREGHPKDAVVIAREQSRGKGTKGRGFYSPKNSGLYLSVLMHTEKKLSDLHPPTPAAAVAVKRAMEDIFGIRPKIKWVNDIQIDGKKVCGILAESVIDASTGNALIVIGAGTNLFTKVFPEELRDKATSIAEHAEITDGNRYAALLVNNLFTLAKTPDPSAYMPEYRKDSSVLGHIVSCSRNDEVINGKAIDFTDEGHLVLDSNGKSIVVFSGDVSIAVQ